jgi:hypothetical protein
VFDKRTGLPRALFEIPRDIFLRPELCKSASSGKPYLLQFVPLVALVREQRFAPAQAGDAFHVLRTTFLPVEATGTVWRRCAPGRKKIGASIFGASI